MVRGKGKILSIAEREGLINEKGDLEATLKNNEFDGDKRIDRVAVQRQINHLDKAIHDGEAPKVRGVNKDKLWARAKEIAEEIKKGMPTKFEMDNPGVGAGSVGKHMKWDKRTFALREEYRQIMRMLEPDDPTAVDVERFRLEK